MQNGHFVCPATFLYVFNPCPNNHQAAVSYKNFSLDSCLSGSKDGIVLETRFDLRAMMKNAIKTSAQMVAYMGSEMSQHCLTMVKSFGVTGSAC